MDDETLREAISAHYTAGEIVETLDLTSEEIFDILIDRIKDNREAFDLVPNYVEGLGYEEEETHFETEEPNSSCFE